MWEYERIETVFGSYTPYKFFELLNNYAKEAWEIIHYEERFNNGTNYKFVVVLKRKVKG